MNGFSSKKPGACQPQQLQWKKASQAHIKKRRVKQADRELLSTTEQHSRGEASTPHGSSFPTASNAPLDHLERLDASCGKIARNSIVPAGPGYSFSHPQTRFGDQQFDYQRGIQLQTNYLESLAARVPAPFKLGDEHLAKERLRAALAKVVQNAFQSSGAEHAMPFGATSIDLRCIGSLRNGFALPGAVLDLSVYTSASAHSPEVEPVCPRVLEKAFLDAGFGARALSRPGGTVIKLCEKPSKQFLVELKSQRQEWAAVSRKVARAGLESRAVGVSQSPRTKADSFHFSGDVGIQCEISFGGRLSLYNTELLRCYAICDERVRQVGIFVKMWAKNRGINSPHCGTLSSDAYLFMVIHYLMNVAQPPVVHNLQAMAKQHPKQSKIAVVNGWNVQYYNSERNLRARAKVNAMSRNRQSVGELLRGFFAYYGSHGRDVPLSGFHWVNNTISIRTPGGIVPKREKGWTAAKMDDSGARIHFLLAIEDPFQLDRNVAANVTHIGLNAIKAEFRRAQNIITHIQEIPGAGWEWRNQEGDIGQDLLAEFQTLSSRQQKPSGSGNRSSTSPNDPHGHLAQGQPEWNVPSSNASSTGNPNSLIRPVVTAEKLEQQAHREDFRRQTAVAANTMRRMLRQPEPAPVRLFRFTLDSRQFHGPSAIRDRAPCSDTSSEA